MKIALFISCSLILISSCDCQNEIETKAIKQTEDTISSIKKKEILKIASQEFQVENVPETNFDFFKTKIVKTEGNHTEIEKWL